MMAEAESGKKNERDPVIEHFVELRKYIEHSHDGLSGRLEKVESRLGTVESGQRRLERKLDSGLDRVERKLDVGLERVERKLDALIDVRRAPRRRRKP